MNNTWQYINIWLWFCVSMQSLNVNSNKLHPHLWKKWRICLTVCCNKCTYITIANLIHCFAICWFFQRFKTPRSYMSFHCIARVFHVNTAKLPRWQSGLGVQLGSQRVTCSIPLEDSFFILSCSPSLQFVGAFANEIEHDHSPVVIVCLDLGYD